MNDRLLTRGQRVTLRCQECRAPVEVETGNCSDAVLYERLMAETQGGVFCRECKRQQEPQPTPEARRAQARRSRALFE